LIITVFIALTVYVSMIFFTKYRTPIAVLGSGILLLYGTLSGSFPANQAFQKFPTEIVILIVVLALFTKVFENLGFFEYIGNKFYELSKGKKTIIAILVPFSIYAVSLFMNNLSAVLLCTFICLELSVKLKLPVTPLLVSAIIASNIGGAPLPWADTPAVVLTLYSDFNLYDFLSRLFIPCAIYISLLIFYTVWWFKYEEEKLDPEKESIPSQLLALEEHRKNMPPPPPHHLQDPNREGLLDIPPHVGGVKPVPPFQDPVKFIYWDCKDGSNEKCCNKGIDNENMKTSDNTSKNTEIKASDNGVTKDEHEKEIKVDKTKKNHKRSLIQVVVPTVLFILLIAFICVAPFYNISIAYVSAIFIGLILLSSKINPDEVLNSLTVLDSLTFIAALFLIAGVLEFSGALKAVVEYILALTNGNIYAIELSIMFCAFIIATFLSAGPAAATLLPICQQLSPLVGDRLVYAALALGILAGSSMLPWSATGGPVMLSEVGRFLSEREIDIKDRKNISRVFKLKHYLAFSIPFSLVILLLSGLFLMLYMIVR
jgi:Na+/H+ antiporter NhaD/arsenite permease-like protein